MKASERIHPLIDCTNGKLDEALEFAEKRGDKSLLECLDRLNRHDKVSREEYHRNVETSIYPDFVPLSFEFVRKDLDENRIRMNGGIIFHGSHDGFGSGSAPTFSVCLEPTSGWSIHT